MFFGQLVLGLVNGAFYAMLSVGLAVIFGMLHVINVAHGAMYMLGAFGAWLLLTRLHISYWWALLLVPLALAALGVVLERLLIRRMYKLHHLYSFLLTYGLAVTAENLMRIRFGSYGQPYENPLPGSFDLGLLQLPYYRAMVVGLSLLACMGTWLAIERTRLGAYLRAATERPDLVRAFGIRVPRMLTGTYAFGVALAGLAGVMAAPIYQVSPLMGSNIVIVAFAIIVIGGMGSIPGAVAAGFLLGLIEALTKIVYPEASSAVIFLIMVVVLTVRPTGLFGAAK